MAVRVLSDVVFEVQRLLGKEDPVVLDLTRASPVGSPVGSDPNYVVTLRRLAERAETKSLALWALDQLGQRTPDLRANAVVRYAGDFHDSASLLQISPSERQAFADLAPYVAKRVSRYGREWNKAHMVAVWQLVGDVLDNMSQGGQVVWNTANRGLGATLDASYRSHGDRKVKKVLDILERLGRQHEASPDTDNRIEVIRAPNFVQIPLDQRKAFLDLMPYAQSRADFYGQRGSDTVAWSWDMVKSLLEALGHGAQITTALARSLYNRLTEEVGEGKKGGFGDPSDSAYSAVTSILLSLTQTIAPSHPEKLDLLTVRGRRRAGPQVSDERQVRHRQCSYSVRRTHLIGSAFRGSRMGTNVVAR